MSGWVKSTRKIPFRAERSRRGLQQSANVSRLKGFLGGAVFSHPYACISQGDDDYDA